MKIKSKDIHFECINLPERLDRKNWIIEHFNKLQIPFNFFNAHKQNDKYPKLKFSQKYTKGTIGCAISHYDLIKTYSGNQVLGIFEDDVILSEDFWDRMDYIENNFNLDWDIFYLSSFYHLNTDDKRWNKSGDFEFTGVKYIHRVYGSFCTHAYLVNPKSINKILSLIEENISLSYAIDHLYILIQPKLNCFAFTPGMANQIAGKSDVDSNNRKDQTIFEKICGKHYFVNKLSDFDYDQYFNKKISKNIKEYIFKGEKKYHIYNYDYFTTEYKIKSEQEIEELKDYKEILDWLKKFNPNKKVIDIGGNCGLFCIPSSLLGYETYTFEPVKMNVDLLEIGKQKNNCQNLKIIPLGLSNTNEKKIIYVPYCSDNSSFNKEVAISNLKNKNYDQEEINCVKFDDWLKENPISNIGFIKIDVQGYEKPVLEGMSEFLESCNNVCIFLEWDKKHTEMAGFKLQDIFKILTLKGFKEMQTLFNDKIFYKE